MIEAIMPMKRKDFWDMGGIGGLLKGKLFHEAIEKHLPVPNIEECPIPFACTAYDTVRFRTKKITSGSIATAARASCTFPGLFQPVMIDGTPHIDGGVWDWTGLMALDECILEDARRKQANSTSSADATSSSTTKLDLETLFPRNKLIVNVCYDTDFGSRLPASLSHARLLTIVVENIPAVTPFTMGKMGIEAYKLAKAAMHRALFSCHMQELSSNHWCCYVDGKLVHHIPPEIRNSLPSPQVSVDEPFTPRSLPLPTQANISQRSSQQQLSLPTSQQPSSTQARLGQLSRTSSSITNTSDHNLAETALFHVHEEQAPSESSSEDEVAQSSSLLPSMPGVNLLPSFHLPHLPEHLGDFVPLPSYHFVNGTYFYEAFHHTAQNAADTLHHTLHAVNTTMTSTLDSLLAMGSTGRGIKRRREEDDEKEAETVSSSSDQSGNQMEKDTSSSSEGDRPSKQARVEDENHTQVDDDATHHSSSQVSAFDATGLSSTLVDSQCEELMDYPASRGAASTTNGRVGTDHPRRDSEDLDDALAILDAVEFMVSSHNLTSTQTQALTTTQDSPSALQPMSQQTQYSPPRTQVSPPTTGIEDAIEVFASVLDGEVAGAE